MAKIRIGAVDYLNARPLVFGLERGLGADRVSLSYAVPAELARQMARGEVDIGLLPVVELARLPDLEIVPGLGITTRGPARSVRLVARRPLSEIRSVALDAESCTSNALVQVLFAEVWNRRPRFEPGPGDLAQALDGHDAVLRIGDKALFEPLRQGWEVVDLGEAWTRATGLPFVFAAWAARTGTVNDDLYRLLHASRREGVRAVEKIAAAYRWQGRADAELALRYLTEHIHYRLGASELEALRRFFDAAARLGLIEQPPRIRLALQRQGPCVESGALRGSRA